MKKIRPMIFTLVVAIFLLITGCVSDSPGDRDVKEHHETFTQVSTIDALLNGIYDGVISYEELSEYGDFGLGTFEGLDGEMLAFDGDFYQVKADGVAYGVKDEMKTPFAQIVFFNAEQSLHLGDEIDYDNLDDFLDNELLTENIFYAIRIEGNFDYVKTRSVPGQSKPYPPLVEVTAKQSTFEFHDVDGTIVGFRSPPYVGGIGVPGYHLHFLTRDGTAGGHVLELDVNEATASIDHISDFFMILPGEGSDFYQVDFSEDKMDDLHQAER